MSKVYSFRLNDDNPREAQAREVIDTWVSEGYSLRYIITESLIVMGDEGRNKFDLELALDEIKELLMGGQDKEGSLKEKAAAQVLPTSFKKAIKNAARTGIMNTQ